MKTCLWCQADFTPNRDWQKWCCTDHQQRWHRHQRKLADVQAAEAWRVNGKPAGVREVVERRFATVMAPAPKIERRL